MQIANFDQLVRLSNQFINQQKLVRKIESIMTFQDETLVTNYINNYRTSKLKREKERLAQIRYQFYQLIDTIPFPEEL